MDQTFKCRQKLVYNNNIPKAIESKDANEDYQMQDQEEEEDLDNFMEVEVSGIFIKHDFDHILVDESEVEKYMKNKLTHSTMKQTLFVPYIYDI